MAKYSYGQLEQLWIQNGGPASLAPIAAAIAMAESGGNSAALNPTDNGGRQTSWGLWQISNGTHAQPVANILDPNVNAGQAVAKYNARHNWSPWGTYTSGAYRKFLQSGVAPTSAGVPAGGSGPGADLGGPVGGTTSTPAIDVSATSGTNTTGVGASCLLGYSGSFGSFCVLSKAEVRSLIGGFIMVAGATVTLIGLVLLVRGTFVNPITQPTVVVNVPKQATQEAAASTTRPPAPYRRSTPRTSQPAQVSATRGRPSPRVVHVLTKPRTLALPGGKS